MQELAARTADITRSSVQKAVVVLARQPLFGAIRSKLEIVTAALFNERDFTRTDILGEFRLSISRMRLASQDDAQLIYAGARTGWRALVFFSRTLAEQVPRRARS